MAVVGSKPELGSSQKRYLGFKTIARAIPTWIEIVDSDAFEWSTLAKETLKWWWVVEAILGVTMRRC